MLGSMNTLTQLPVPFSRDDLRGDLLTLHLMHMRISALFGSDEAVFGLIGKTLPDDYAEGQLWMADVEAPEYGLSINDVVGTTFSLAVQQQYAFAFEGVLTTGLEPMQYETMHTWVAAYLMDMNRSALASEWQSFGFDCEDAIRRCLHICELANARLVLEGRGYFSYFQRVRPGSEDEAATAVDALTIRQVALLAGMEEMSVRTAASRKGPNQLPIYKDAGRTLVRPADAVEWLKSKNRYISVTRKWDGRELQLDRTTFSSLDEIQVALLDYTDKQATEKPGSQMLARVEALLRAHGHEPFLHISPEIASDATLLKEMAAILALPPELFALRVEQAFHAHRLKRLEQEIKQTLQSTN